jgi:hypothetical protein
VVFVSILVAACISLTASRALFSDVSLNPGSCKAQCKGLCFRTHVISIQTQVNREREREFVAHVLGLANFDLSLPLPSPACPRWLVPFYHLRAGKRRKQHPRTTSFCHACRHVNNNHVSRNANVQALAFQLANQCQPPATRTGHRTGGEQVKSLVIQIVFGFFSHLTKV